jgi:hypothetical protein
MQFQRRDKVVRLNPHIQEAPQHIHHIVRMDCRKHQMPGQRRVDRNLRRLRIADLADKNLVRVMPQDRPQPARKRQPLLLIHRDLRDPPYLVLDGVLNRNDLVFLSS